MSLVQATTGGTDTSNMQNAEPTNFATMLNAILSNVPCPDCGATGHGGLLLCQDEGDTEPGDVCCFTCSMGFTVHGLLARDE